MSKERSWSKLFTLLLGGQCVQASIMTFAPVRIAGASTGGGPWVTRSMCCRPDSKNSDSKNPIFPVETPALVVWRPAFDGNRAALKRAMETLDGNIAVRAHCKAHKSGEVAKIQTEEDGCVGVCAQVHPLGFNLQSRHAMQGLPACLF